MIFRQVVNGIVKEIGDPRIFYECNGKNLGMIKSFNKSILKAKSEYIVTVTDDDHVDLSMLTDFHKIISQYPGYPIYLGCRRNKREENAIEIFKKEDYLFQILHPKLTQNILWSSGIMKTRHGPEHWRNSRFWKSAFCGPCFTGLIGQRKWWRVN